MQKKKSPEKSSLKPIRQNSNSDYLSDSRSIPNTPFVARKQGDRFFLTIGNYKTPHILSSFDECTELAVNPDWDCIMTVMQSVVDVVLTMKNQTK